VSVSVSSTLPAISDHSGASARRSIRSDPSRSISAITPSLRGPTGSGAAGSR
jgi:hypothetical protein